MYYGTMSGGGRPYALGEVSEEGFGPYLGGFFDTVQKIAEKVGGVAGELSDVSTGRSKITTVDAHSPSLVLPFGSSPYAPSLSLTTLALIGVGGYLLLRGGRRRR